MSDTPWPHFSAAELACRCGCGLGHESMDTGFMDALEDIRRTCGFPLPVTSAIRCPEHNARVSATGRDGPHTTGRAVDISIRGARALELVVEAVANGMTGIGVQQRGADRFIHLDDLDDAARRPRPWLWSYA